MCVCVTKAATCPCCTNCITTQDLSEEKPPLRSAIKAPLPRRIPVTLADPSAFSPVPYTSFIPPPSYISSGTLSPPQQLDGVPLSHGGHASSRASLLPPLAQTDGRNNPPMNQSEGCGREGGRDRSSLLVAGAQAA